MSRSVGKRFVEIVGRVLRADDGSPIAGARVKFTRTGPTFRERSRHFLTDSDGQFRVRTVFDPGAWRGFGRLEAVAPGLERVQVNCFAPQGPVVAYTLRLRAALTVCGHIERHRGTKWGRLTVHAADARCWGSEHPQDVFREWMGDGDDVVGGVRWTARVAANGSFRLDGVPAGVELMAEVRSDRHPHYLHPLFEIPASEGEPAPIKVTVAQKVFL